MRTTTRWVLALFFAAAPLRAQRSTTVNVDLSAEDAARGTPAISASHVLDDPQLQELMHNGFGVHLRYRLELWRTGGVFNDLERSRSWDVYVQYQPDPYRAAYSIVRHDGNQTENFGAVALLDSAQAILARPYRVRLAPSHPGARYYYNVVLDVESLNASDLSELERWLHGDLQPAVRGKANPLSALENGVGRLLSRALGGANRSYEATSSTFRAPATP